MTPSGDGGAADGAPATGMGGPGRGPAKRAAGGEALHAAGKAYEGWAPPAARATAGAGIRHRIGPPGRASDPVGSTGAGLDRDTRARPRVHIGDGRGGGAP